MTATNSIKTREKRAAAAGAGILDPAGSVGSEATLTAAAKYFLSYQSAWIKDESRLKICEKGRQIGLSYADSYDSVRKAAVKNAKDVWVMSRDEVQAKQYILYCKRWANVLKYACEDHGEQVFETASGKSIKVQALSFASGANIYALSSNPDAIVGKTGHVKLDEFALHANQRELYAVAKPVIQWGGTLSIISTHRGIGTVFNDLLVDAKERGNKMGWSVHRIPIQRAVEDGLVEKIDAATGATGVADVAARREAWLAQQRAECIDEEQWLQEYCCVPADEASAFLSYDLISSCEDAGLKLMNMTQLEDWLHSPITKEPTLYLGVDVARKKDLCVLDLGEKLGDVVHDRLRIELQNKSFSEIKADLYRLLRLPAVKRCDIDATGMGMQLAEEAKSDFGWKVEPITFTAPVKEELAFGMRADFEDRRVRIVRDDKLRADLRGIKKETTLSGNIRFVGESEDSHCDRFWAKALRQAAARFRAQLGAMVG